MFALVHCDNLSSVPRCMNRDRQHVAESQGCSVLKQESRSAATVESVPSLAGHRLTLVHLGLGLHWAWTYLCFYSPVLFADSPHLVPRVHILLLVSILSHAVALILTATLGSRLSHRQRIHLLIASCLAAALGTLLAGAGGRMDPYSLPLLVCGAALTGFGTASIVIGWGELYGSLGARRASVTTAASALAAVVIYFLVTSIPPISDQVRTLQCILTALLPALSGLLVWLSIKNTPIIVHPALPTGMTRGFPIPWRLAVGVGAYGSVFGLMRGITDIPSSAETFVTVGRFAVLGSAAIAVLIGLGSLVSRRDLDIGFTYRPVLPLMIAGLLLLPLYGLEDGTFARVVLGTSFTYLDIFVWIVLSDLTFRIQKPATHIFGWGRALMSTSVFVGWFVGFGIADRIAIDSRLISGFSLASVLLLVISAVMVLNEKDVFGLWGSPEGSVSVADSEKPLGQWKRRCISVSQSHGLSPREEEVLLLLAKGRSIPFIRDELGIAGGTVQAHVTHIYRKLDVHNRQQLIDVIESCPDQD